MWKRRGRVAAGACKRGLPTAVNKKQGRDDDDSFPTCSTCFRNQQQLYLSVQISTRFLVGNLKQN